MAVTSADHEPYVGLRPYDIDDVDRFFGRSRESWELTSLVLSSRLVVVYGPPGAGKTSLLQAGVLARFSPDMAQVLPVAHPPRASTLPSGSDADRNPLVVDLLSSWAPETDPEPDVDSRQAATVTQFLRSVPVRLDRYDEAPLPLIAVIDQFDDLFRLAPDWVSHRDDLLAQLAEAMDEVEHVHLVLSMRHDVVGQFLPYELSLSAGSRRRYQVEALDPPSALDAVTAPLRTVRNPARAFAPGVAEELVDRLRTTTITNEVGEQRTVQAPTVDPTNLQVVCSALWRGLPDGVTTITSEHLQDYGDVENTLTDFCVRAVIEVASSEGIEVQQVWDWLEEAFITDHGTRGAAYEGLAWTGGMPNEVAHAFERRRILRSEERSGSMWFELLNDALLEPIRRGRRLSVGLAEVAGPDARPDDFLLMAQSALHSGMLPLAERYAEGAVRASGNDARNLAEAKSFLGELVFDHGRTETGDRAERLYETAEDNFRRAAELFETQQNSQAVGRVLASLGRLDMERGRFADAVRDLRSALQRLPRDPGIRLQFARALRSTGQAQAALSEYTAVLSSAPVEARAQRIEALLERGVVSAEHGDPAAALRDIDDVSRLQPDLATRPDVVAARSRAVARMERRQ